MTMAVKVCRPRHPHKPSERAKKTGVPFGTPVKIRLTVLVAVAAAAAGWLSAEAIAAVDGPVSAWKKRHFSLFTALGTGCRVHLTTAVASAAAAAATLALPCRSATRAALGLVCVALVSVVLLIVRAKDELGTAVLAG